MTYRKEMGRPSKITWAVIIKLADSLQHNATIGEACRYARISRSTYYYHLSNDDIFAIKMLAALDNQNKAVFSFQTTF